jgi:HK97 family phage major capsid protein/HK97 family phage prohead protease
VVDGIEVRHVSHGLRAESSGAQSPRLVGLAIATGVPSEDLGGFREIIAPAAVRAALAGNPDLVALRDHDRARVLGRVSAKTLRVHAADDGLRFEIDPPEHARDLVESVARGDVTGASFSFTDAVDTWDLRSTPPVRTITSFRLREISAGVLWPAYPQTHVTALRSLESARAQETPPMPETIAPPVAPSPDPVPPVPVVVESRDVEVVDLETRVLKPGDSVRAWTERARGKDDYARLTLGAFLRAAVCGPRTDVERRALAEGSDATGGFTVPEITASAFIDRMRAATVCVRAGARTVPLTSDKTTIARLASDVTTAWRNENAEVVASDPTFEGVVFTPRSLAALVRVSRELLEDSLNIESMLERSFAAAFALEVDRVALRGSGTAPEPRGITNTTGVNSVAGGGALTNYDKVLDAVGAILADNGPVPSAVVMPPGVYVGTAKMKESTTNAPLARPPIVSDMTFYPTSSLTDVVVLGGFDQLLLGVRSSLRVEVLRERYAEFVQYGFLGHLRMDVALEHPEAFAQITAVTP